MTSPQLCANVGVGSPMTAINFRRTSIASLRPRTRPSEIASSPRSRGRLVAQSRSRRAGKPQPKEAEEETTEGKTGLFSGLFGGKTGTQRLKAGQQEDETTPRPSKGKRPANESKKSAPSFLQTTRIGRKDQNTVFVAGATGRLGLRVVRELLNAGFKVRAGARNTEKAQSFVDTAQSIGLLSGDAVKRLQIVPVDLEDEGSISAALGNATRVVQAIGAAENNVLDIGAPKRIDGQAAISLVNASVEAGVTQYVMVTSLGTEKFGWPASILNLFGGILTQKRKAEKALEASGLKFTIVRPGGMEKPGDDYKKVNNVRISTKNKLFGGLVSRLQVAELITSAVINPELSENQTYEVTAEKTAPKVDYEELLRNFGSSSTVTEPELQVEEEPPQESSPARSIRRPKRVDSRRSVPLQNQNAELSGNQDAIAEDIAKKEVDIKLKRDAPEPSAESKNLAEDIARAEILIDSGKEKSTKNWFGFGKSKEDKKEARADDSEPSTSGSNPIEAVQSTIKKQIQSPEDLERFRSTRDQSVKSRAQKEADFLARLETQRQEELAKNKQARDKREKEALDKARSARDAILKKQEEQQTFAKTEEDKRIKTIAERVAKSKAEGPKPAAKDKADPISRGGSVTDAAQQQAKANAQAAKVWIEEWKSGQNGGNGSTPKAESGGKPTEGVTEEAQANAQEARRWIEEWRAGQKGENGSSPSTQAVQKDTSKNGASPGPESKNGAISESAQGARKWIEEWRSRSAGKS